MNFCPKNSHYTQGCTDIYVCMYYWYNANSIEVRYLPFEKGRVVKKLIENFLINA